MEPTRRREEILRAARVLFSKKGYPGTTIQEVAERAGITKGTVYLYFKNKKDLLASVIESEMKGLLESMREVRESGLSIEERLVEMILTILNFRQQRELYRLFDPDVSRIPPSLREVFKRRIRPRFEELVRLIEETLEQGIKEGRFKAMDPFKVALVLLGMVMAIQKSWTLGAKIDPEDGVIIRELLHSGLLLKSGGEK